MSRIHEIIKIADIHAEKIKKALGKISSLFPTSKSTIEEISEDDFLWIELLVNRFAKLQDFMGSKLIDAFLESKGEVIDNLTMIDKIHRLEKLNLIESAAVWTHMREIRNHLAHEYPDHPELISEYLNQMFELTSKLLLLLENIKRLSDDD